MTATFDPNLPTDLDRMRDALGDTDTDAPLAPDVTYDARLIEYGGSWRLAAAAMARSFAARAINDPTSFTATGDMAVTWADRAKGWLELAKSLEGDASAQDRASGFGVALPTRPDIGDEGEYSVRFGGRQW